MKVYIPHTIRIRLPHARQVSVVGDFNNWHSSAHPLVQVGPDLWERIVDLPPGKHRYAFFVIDDLVASADFRHRLGSLSADLARADSPGDTTTQYTLGMQTTFAAGAGSLQFAGKTTTDSLMVARVSGARPGDTFDVLVN